MRLITCKKNGLTEKLWTVERILIVCCSRKAVTQSAARKVAWRRAFVQQNRASEKLALNIANYWRYANYDATKYCFPTVEDGLEGIRFIERSIASSSSDSSWVNF